jgi:hypothetical protein
MRMCHLGAFFRRIIEWEYPDAPGRPPVYASDVPIKDKPLGLPGGWRRNLHPWKTSASTPASTRQVLHPQIGRDSLTVCQPCGRDRV